MADQPEFVIQKIYMKDVSFESPDAPDVFLQEWQPSISTDLDIDSKSLEDGNYNVQLSITVTAKMKEKTVFIAEVKQAGVFLIKNIPETEMDGILKGVCPNVLFPYCRERISSLITDGGFPPLYLSPMNFEAIHAQEAMGKAANEN